MNTQRLRECGAFALRAPMVRAGLYAMVASALWLCASAGFYWLPQAHATQKLQDALERARARAVAALERRQTARLYIVATRRMAVLEKKMRMPHPQASLIGELAGLAQREHVEIAGEAYAEGAPDGRGAYRRLDCDLALQGPYGDMRAFLAGLQNLPTWTLVREGALVAVPGSIGTVKARLRLATFYHGKNIKTNGRM